MRSDEPSTRSGRPLLIANSQDPAHASTSIDLQERERVRIGFDLHDGPAQTMSAALLEVRMLDGLDGDALQRGIDELRSTLTVALEEIYALIESLGARDSEGLDLAGRVRSCVEGFRDRFGIPAELEVEGDCGQVTPSLQIATFRIVQEALSNAGQHSRASRICVHLVLSPADVRCEIEDDGVGFVQGQPVMARSGRETFGLRSMSERASMLGGVCIVDSAPGAGTRVSVTIPVWRG
jgi:signal transduction histidine kinase